MTDKDSNAMKAQKASEKATVKMHDDVTASLDQLEHPGTKAPKGSDEVKHKAVSATKSAAHGSGSKSKKKK
jgi:hypothetical protein